MKKEHLSTHTGVKNMSKEIVVPGELICEEPKQLGVHTFAREGKIFADCLGIKNESEDRVAVVPLRGKYVPVENDVIIGVVTHEKFAGYDIEINSFYPSFISNKDLRDPLKVGNVISAKIVKVNELNEADLGMVRSLNDGEVLTVTPVKVPRIIGKNASMLNAIKNGTGSSIMVGRNGLVWIQGGNATLASEAILRIEEFSHAENLTHDIQSFLAVKTGQGLPGTQGPSNEDAFESGFDLREGGFDRRGGFGGRREFRPRNDFRRGPGMGRRDLGMGMSRGFFPGNRRFGMDRRSGSSSSGGGFERRGGFAPRRPRSDEGYRVNPRFGGGNDAPPFERRKRFPRDDRRNDRVRGDEDPVFE
mgnify:CR=1 FL=1